MITMKLMFLKLLPPYHPLLIIHMGPLRRVITRQGLCLHPHRIPLRVPRFHLDQSNSSQVDTHVATFFVRAQHIQQH